MKLNIKGTYLKCQTQSGTSVKGNHWEKYDVIVMVSGKTIQVTFFGENFKHLQFIEPATEVEIVGFLESKEGVTGRYFTGVNGVEFKTANEVKSKIAESAVGNSKLDAQFDKSIKDDDLPF